MRTRLPSALLAALACSVFAVSAQAQSPRTFVSAAGNDSNPCSFAAPCRHFQAAVNATSPGGEVDALDPAGYGPITISQAITIEGQGWSYIAPPASGNAITINAVSGNVSIHGVSLNGVGISGSTNGIAFFSGSSLNVRDSVIQNFSSRGILFAPTASSKIFVSDTFIGANSDMGIYIVTSGSQIVSGTLNRVKLQSNTNDGLRVNTTDNTNITVSDSESANNGFGITAITTNSPLNVFVRNSVISNNSNTGLVANGIVATIRITRSTVTGNGLDWSTTIGGSVTSYSDNNFDANSTTNGGALGAAPYR
jgi:hypothetical protein